MWTDVRRQCWYCGQACRVVSNTDHEREVPAPWRSFELAGWAGVFWACSSECEDGARERARQLVHGNDRHDD